MRKLLVMLIVLAGLFACTSNEKQNPKKITAKEAYQMMHDDNPYVLLDVRTATEFEEGHIEHAILIPDYELEKQAEQILTDKEARILIYCRSGRRSEQAANILETLGYTNIYDFGGIIDWPYDVK